MSNPSVANATAPPVFISYSTKDEVEATAVCRAVERLQCPCWMAPRNISGGSKYSEAIVSAIDGCRVFLLLLSSAAQSSPHVERELEHAVSSGKLVIAMKLDSAPPSMSFGYFLKLTQWFHASVPLSPALLSKLARVIAEKAGRGPQNELADRAPKAANPGGFRVAVKTESHVVFEVASKASLQFLLADDRTKISQITNWFSNAVSGAGLALIGMDVSPLTLQFSVGLAGFEKLRQLYLQRKLCSQEEYAWHRLRRLDEPNAAKPWQASFCYDDADPAEDDLNSVVCHLYSITGLKKEADDAAKHVGPPTIKRDECRVYLRSVSDGLYAHSSHQKSGQSFPTKLFVSRMVPLLSVFANLVAEEALTEDECEKLEYDHANKVLYYVEEDRWSFDNVAFFCGAQNVEFVRSDA